MYFSIFPPQILFPCSYLRAKCQYVQLPTNTKWELTLNLFHSYSSTFSILINHLLQSIIFIINILKVCTPLLFIATTSIKATIVPLRYYCNGLPSGSLSLQSLPSLPLLGWCRQEKLTLDEMHTPFLTYWILFTGSFPSGWSASSLAWQTLSCRYWHSASWVSFPVPPGLTLCFTPITSNATGVLD